jgi:hypothetical protein
MRTYRSKVVEVQARELKETTEFHTKSGKQIGEPGDFAITAYGETYPCPRAVFFAKYEPA